MTPDVTLRDHEVSPRVVEGWDLALARGAHVPVCARRSWLTSTRTRRVLKPRSRSAFVAGPRRDRERGGTLGFEGAENPARASFHLSEGPDLRRLSSCSIEKVASFEKRARLTFAKVWSFANLDCLISRRSRPS